MSCGTTQCVKEEMYTNSSGYTKRERVIQLKFQKNKKSQIKNLNNYLKRWNNDKNLILVTHYVVILEMLNYAPSSGEIVVSDKNLNLIGTLKIEY